MGLQVKSKGKLSEFDRLRFRKWIAREYEVSDNLAKKIARTTHQVAKQQFEVVESNQLPGIAGALIGQSLTYATSLGPSLPLMQAGSSMMKIPSIGVGEAITAGTTVANVIFDYFKKKGWEDEDPGYMIIEQVGFLPPFDDQKAPEIGEVTFANATCCKTGLGACGIMIDVNVPVTDTGGIGNSSGVKSVKVSGVHMEGTKFFLSPNKTKKLTEEEEEKSEDEEVTITVSLCIPCKFIIDGVLKILIQVMDDDDNGRICLTRIALPDAILDKCCKKE